MGWQRYRDGLPPARTPTEKETTLRLPPPPSAPALLGNPGGSLDAFGAFGGVLGAVVEVVVRPFVVAVAIAVKPFGGLSRPGDHGAGLAAEGYGEGFRVVVLQGDVAVLAPTLAASLSSTLYAAVLARSLFLALAAAAAALSLAGGGLVASGSGLSGISGLSLGRAGLEKVVLVVLFIFREGEVPGLEDDGRGL